MTEEVQTPPGEQESTPPATPPVDVSAYEAQIAKLEAEKQKAVGESMERKRKLAAFDGVDLEEYKRLTETFGNVSGDEFEKLQSALAAAKTDEERKLLAEKGLEGFVEHQTSARLKSTQTAHEKQMAEKDQTLTETQKRLDAAVSQMNTMRLEGAVFGAWTDKLQDSAKADALLHARNDAKFDDDGTITWTVNGEEIFGKDGKPATAAEYMEAKTKDFVHWLKPSVGATAPGSGGGKPPADNPFAKPTPANLGLRLKIMGEDKALADKLQAAAKAA